MKTKRLRRPSRRQLSSHSRTANSGATILRIGSRGSQLAHLRVDSAKSEMEQNSSCIGRNPSVSSHDRSTLVLLKWGFGEYYQCGYWAALENRGSRLFAAARGSNPLLSAAVRDPRDIRTCSTRKSSLTHSSANAKFRKVLKRGLAPFLGGLTSRLLFFCDVLPRVSYHA
jgi:hypothetical protein